MVLYNFSESMMSDPKKNIWEKVSYRNVYFRYDFHFATSFDI